MRRIMAGSVRKGVACILAVSLCLTGIFVGGGWEGAVPVASAVRLTSEDEVWEYEADSSGKATITGYHGADTKLCIPETLQDSDGESYDVTGIGNYAFEGCENLTSIEIPAGVKSIGLGILKGCSSIREITVSEENTEYESPKGCNVIISRYSGVRLVAGCQSSRIPDDVRYICSDAFAGCTTLTNITFPEGLREIWSYAFSGCTALTDVKFPEGLTTIDDYAFSGCSGITRIEIPASVENFGYYGGYNPFAGCSLQEIKVAEGNKYYSSGDNCNAIFYDYDGDSHDVSLVVGCSNTIFPEEMEISIIARNAFSGCAGLESIHIPSTVNEIDSNAFENCTNLQRVDFAEENSVEQIGRSAFRGCTSLKDISLPSGITGVSDYTFYGCTGLEQLQIPDGVECFNSHAFAGCSSLREIHCPENLESIGVCVFRVYEPEGDCNPIRGNANQ